MILKGLQEPRFLRKVAMVARPVECYYMLYKPLSYDGTQKTTWPLLLFLHGLDARGDDLEILAESDYNIAARARAALQDRFMIVTPQLPSYEWQWNTDVLATLIEEIVYIYKIDKSRIYVTGASIGAYGTWALAIESPRQFAAIAPVMGAGDPEKVCKLKQVPVWTFHGMKDTTIPFEDAEEMVQTLKECGGDVRFSTYEDRGHDLLDVYDDPKLYDWFLQHRGK